MNEQSSIPVEAQAVPDQPVATEPFWHAVVSEKCPVINKAIRRADVADEYAQKCRNDGYTGVEVIPLFTRPTPAAADLHQQIMNLPCRPKRGTSDRREHEEWPESVLRAYIDGHKDARHAAAQFVAASPAAAAAQQELRHATTWSGDCPHWCEACATRDASPAAAAGVPTGLRWRDDMLALLRELRPMADYGRVGTRDIDQGRYQRALDSAIALLAASPVAPVGAPTRLTDEQIVKIAVQTFGKYAYEARSLFIQYANELLSVRPGCELATDATKHLGEHSVHLAATPIDQDFRMRPVSSEAAPRAEVWRDPDTGREVPKPAPGSVDEARRALGLKEPK